ncbi:MAG: nitrate reductase cytochrome c-type subunit [Gammaproteobacteria bacterium]|nr:nitrate reductase cytochrome c-type subunit [Gammaproteobacteria bacterium]
MKTPRMMTLAVLLSVISAVMFSPLSGAGTTGVQTLRAVDVASADQAPEETAQLGAKPGRQQPIERTFEQQPPLISHTTVNFDEITLEENQCLSCHDLANYKKKEAPKIGEKHFVDADGKVQEVVVGLRYVCTQCHVSQTNASPLVENTFRSVPVKAAEAQ